MPRAPLLIVITALVLAALGAIVPAQDILIPKGAVWKYRDDGATLTPDWQLPAFFDEGWPAGPAPMGYGEDYIRTPVSPGPADSPHMVHYFRHAFNVAVPTNYRLLQLNLRRDDGAIVFINGAEILRSNMEPGAVDNRTLSVRIVFGDEEATYFTFPIVASVLRPGRNVITVQVHQRDQTSSDLILDAELLGLSNVAQARLNPVLDAWYADYPSALGTSLMTRRPLMIYYYTDSHAHSRAINQQVFAKETINELMGRSVVRVAINAENPAARAMLQRDQVIQVPSVLIHGHGWPHPLRSIGNVDPEDMERILKSLSVAQ